MIKNLLTFAVILMCPLAPLVEASDTQKKEPDAQYAPNPAFPFGRMNPAAPRELKQFSFMVGEFDCIDKMRQKDGTWKFFPAIWNAHYFLNGLGIQDEYWTPEFFTSNIRIYDPKEALWKVTFFQMPRYQSGVWYGVKEGDKMVMRKGKEATGPGLTFHEISDDGFQWRSGGDNPGWTSSCRRRR